jgi:sRNA-binding regulator protein Hfq
MADVVKSGWFGREVSVLMVNGKSITGELSEVCDNFLVLTRGGAEHQIMVHAIVAIRLAGERDGEAAQ